MAEHLDGEGPLLGGPLQVMQGLVAAIDSSLCRAEDAPAVAITPAGLAAIGCPEPMEDTHARTKAGRARGSASRA